MNLSIIIPHYNTPKLLKVLLDTIPKMPDLEIIVIDDNSTVPLGEWIKQEPNTIVYHNDTGIKSAGTCRNIGLRHAQGDWILFADADDYFLPGLYDTVSPYFTSNEDVVFFKPTSIEPDTGQVSLRHVYYERLVEKYLTEKNKAAEIALRYQFEVPWSKLIRRKMIIKNQIQFDETLASNDVMFSAKIGHVMQSFSVSEKIIYCVTLNHGTLTVQMTEAIYDIRLAVFMNHCSFLQNHLTKKELKMINFHGRLYFVNAIKYKLGIKKALKVFVLLHKHGIPVLDVKFLNPYILVRNIVKQLQLYTSEKKYYKR